MALTRKLLKGMGLTDEQVDTIIEAHTDTVDGLKADVGKYKSDAEKLPDVQKQLETSRRRAMADIRRSTKRNTRTSRLINPESQQRKARRQRKRLFGLTLKAKISQAQISILPCAAAARK